MNFVRFAPLALVFCLVSGKAAQAGYDITIHPIEFQVLSSDNKPVPGVSYKVMVTTKKRETRSQLCDGQPSCIKEKVLLDKNYLGDERGIVKIPAFSRKSRSGEYRGAMLVGTLDSFRTSKCRGKGGYAYPNDMLLNDNEARWQLAGGAANDFDHDLIGSNCKLSGGLPEDENYVSRVPSGRMVCKFQMTL